MAIIDNLISYWKLDEGSGNAIDAHGSNDGTLSGTVTQGATGKINDAYDFNHATDGRVIITDDPSFSFTNKMSVAAWVKFDDIDTRISKVVTKDNEAIEREWVLQATTTVLNWIIWDTGNTIHVLGDTFNFVQGTWYHIVGTYDGTTMKVYIDGSVRPTTVTSTFNIKQGTRAVVIGSDEGLQGDFSMDGIIDEVLIKNEDLTSTEVSELWNSGAGLAYPFTAPAVGNLHMMGANF